MFEAFWGLPKSCQITLLLQHTCVGVAECVGSRLARSIGPIEPRWGYVHMHGVISFVHSANVSRARPNGSAHSGTGSAHTAQIAPNTSGHHNSSAEIIKTHIRTMPRPTLNGRRVECKRDFPRYETSLALVLCAVLCIRGDCYVVAWVRKAWLCVWLLHTVKTKAKQEIHEIERANDNNNNNNINKIKINSPHTNRAEYALTLRARVYLCMTLICKQQFTLVTHSVRNRSQVTHNNGWACRESAAICARAQAIPGNCNGHEITDAGSHFDERQFTFCRKYLHAYIRQLMSHAMSLSDFESHLCI